MPFKFLEKIATADLAFAATGANLAELFESCAEAVTSAMVDPATVKPVKKIEIKLESNNLSDLLYDFLAEIVAVKDTDGVLFAKFKVGVEQNREYSLKAEALGSEIDPETQELRDDVKAVTKHKFKIEKTSRGFSAQVVLDV